MTKPLREAVSIIAKTMKPKGKVLEIGSRKEVGQRQLADLRKIFSGCEYMGVDMRPGPGVDKVVGDRLPFGDESFDVVLCLEVMEHADKPWVLASEIERLVKKDGWVIISSQQNFPIHNHPSDYFRYTPFGLSVLFNKLKSKLLFSISPPFNDEVKLNPQAVIMVGWKKKGEKKMKNVKKALIENKDKISVHKPYRHRVRDGLKIVLRGINELVFREEIEFF